MATAVTRTAAAGGTDAQQTSAQGFWNQFTATLVAAGWTALDTITSQDIVYTSVGESGNEKLYVRAQWATTNFNVFHYQFWDSTGHAGYNRIGPATSSATQFTFTGGNSLDYIIVATLDSFAAVTRDTTSNNRRLIVGGNIRRASWVNSSFFTSNGSVSSGANAVFNFSSGNPVAAGYKVGDPVMVISQQTSGPAAGVIPVYSAYITALTTSSITIDFAEANTDAGAFIGTDPMPFFFFTNTANTDPGVSTNYVYQGNVFIKYQGNGPSNIYQQGTADLGFVSAILSKGIQNTSAEQAVLDPNNRTSRVLLSDGLINATFGSSDEQRGAVPLFYFNPRTSDAVWAIARTSKQATNQDLVTFPLTMPATGARFAIGPIPTSGSSNYTIDLYNQDSDTWIEGEVTYIIWPGADKNGFAVETDGKNGHPFQADTVSNNDDVSQILAAVYSPLETEQSDKVGSQSTLTPSGESQPFDSLATTTTSTSNGFNPGFN